MSKTQSSNVDGRCDSEWAWVPEIREWEQATQTLWRKMCR